jgi:iron complex outermembrane receptor protein
MDFDRKSRLIARTGARALVAGGALCCFAGAAQAQQTASAASETSPPTSAGAAAAPTEVGDIVVTATRRSEALRNVPIAVTAVTAKQVLENHIENFADLPTIVPGANFISPKGQSTATIVIRGQVTTNDAPALEVPVAIFQDDIYYGTLASFDADFYDINQIAILRGPQGTTFGRNVVGGALQITSNKPQLGVNDGAIIATLEGYAGSGAPSTPGFEAQGYFNTSLAANAAARLAYSVKDVGGYMHNYLTGTNLSDQKSFSVRPSFLWEPTSDLKVSAFVSWTHEDEYASGYNAYGQGSVIASDRAISSSPWASFENVDGHNKRDIVAAQVRADLTRSFGTFSAITSYRTLDANYVDDGDSGPLPTNNNSVNASKEFAFSEELRLTSPTGQRFEYVAGLYYSFENLKKGITFGFNGTDPTTFLSLLTGGALDNQTALGDVHVQNIAPYAEGKLHITDQIALTVGGRYTVEAKNGYTNHIGSSPFYGPAFDTTFGHTWTAFTPRGILEYKPRDGLLFYASVSTGFKGGGWSLTSTNVAAAQTPLQPERSISYEVGTKLRLFEDRVSINIAAYQADTKDLQVRTLVGPVLTDTNAGKERARGVEVETDFHPVRASDFGVNYAYTDATYLSFVGCAPGGVNCSGNQVPYVPRNDVKIFGEYTWNLSGAGALTIHADDEWADATAVTPTPSAQPLAPQFTRKNGFLNAFLIYAPLDKPWTVQLWAKNLTNQWTIAAPSNYYFFFLTKAEYFAGLREVERGTVSPPRQIGATITYRF